MMPMSWWRPGEGWPDQHFDAALVDRCRLRALQARPFVAKTAAAVPVPVIPASAALVRTLPVLSAGAKAEAWLRERLKDAPLPALQVIAEAKAAGIAEATLVRAKKRIGARSFRPDRGQWLWAAKDWQPDDEPLSHAPRRRAYHRSRATGAAHPP
jgi:hypothetical protein